MSAAQLFVTIVNASWFNTVIFAQYLWIHPQFWNLWSETSSNLRWNVCTSSFTLLFLFHKKQSF